MAQLLQGHKVHALSHLSSATTQLARHYPDSHPLRCQLVAGNGLALARSGQREPGERRLRVAIVRLAVGG